MEPTYTPPAHWTPAVIALYEAVRDHFNAFCRCAKCEAFKAAAGIANPY